jgi:uncharacterized protein YciI
MLASPIARVIANFRVAGGRRKMLFVIIGYDGPDGPGLRPSVRPAHLENLKTLIEQKRLIIGGPFTDGAGSLMIVEMESQAQAEEFIRNDPYVKQGVFARVEVRPFRQVAP